MSSHNEPTTTAVAHGADDHSSDPGLYLRTLILLLILTLITVGAAGIQFGTGVANIVIALTIATIKATLVALFFMHLAHDKPVNAIIGVAGFIFLGLFLLFTFLDVGSRVPLLPSNMPAMAQPTPTPTTLNPLLTPPPGPLAPAAPPGAQPVATPPAATPAPATPPAAAGAGEHK
jgi:cytochrome c oxidase subunit IV